MYNFNEVKNEEFDVILLAGQSNAEGSGLGEVNVEYIENKLILELTDTYPVGYKPDQAGNLYFDAKLPTEYKIDIAKEALNAKGAKIGNFALCFAENYEKKYLSKSRKVLIVKAAVGGTGFCKKQWTSDGILYQRAVDMVDTALSFNENNRVVAILWHQGECDAFEGNTPKAYRQQLLTLIRDLRNRYGNVPFIAGDFVSDWKCKNLDCCEPIVKTIREVVEDSKNAAFVETADLPSNNQQTGNGDDIHFCRASLWELGIRYFQKFEELNTVK